MDSITNYRLGVAVVIMYNRTLSASEITQVENYLKKFTLDSTMFHFIAMIKQHLITRQRTKFHYMI